MAKWATDGYDLHLVGPTLGQGGTRQFQLGDYFLPDNSTPWSQNHGQFGNTPFQTIFPYTVAVHGLSVTSAGVLTFSGGVIQGGLDPVRNFIVFVPLAAGGQVTLRIHRHDQLTDFTITPQSLRVRENASLRFTVLATFSDESTTANLPAVCDISRNPDLQWSLTPDSPASSLLVSPGGTMLGLQAGLDATVQVTLPDSLYPPGNLPPVDQRTKSAPVQTLPGWDADLPDDAALAFVRGPGIDSVDNVPNILLLPDGITDRDDFQSIATDIIDRLSYYRTTVPWSQLIQNNVVNVWMGWLDSAEEGGNLLNELRTSQSDNPDDRGGTPNTAYNVVPARPLLGQTITNLAELTYRVGQPTLAATTVLTFADQVNIWSAQYAQAGDQPGQIPAYLNGLTSTLWMRWRDSAQRVLLLEKDTSLGISTGERPQVPDGGDILAVTWHPFRAQRSDLDKYLSKVFAFSGANRASLGNLWTTAGKDANLVFVICNGPRERGTRTRDAQNLLIATNVTDRDNVELPSRPATSAILGADSPPLQPVASVKTVATVFHELNHAFRLGDEYSNDAKDITAGRTTDIRSTKLYWNLVTDADVEDSSSSITHSRIRWATWPRIVAAGTVGVAPTVTSGSPNQFTIVLQSGQGQVFADALAAGKLAANGTLRFRLRPLVQTGNTGDDDASVISDAMVLQSISSNDHIVATGGPSVVTFINDNADDFAAKKVVLLAPRVVNGAEQSVLLPAVGTAIDSNGPFGGPLNRPGSSACALNPLDRPLILTGVIPGITKLPRLAAHIIGLYDGGATFSCGVFHAAGTCAMRREATDPTVPPAVDEIAGVNFSVLVTELCHVCRYVLVDQLAPTLHGVIDDLYSANYPQ